MKLQVLYEDNHVIAVVKPAGILSQGDKTGDTSTYDMVKDYVRIKKGKPSLLNSGNAKPRTEATASSTGVFLGLLHRLDRPVSGIMLFAKTSKGAARFSEQFRSHAVEKTYHALVVGKPNQNKGMLVNYLIKDEKLKKARHKTAPGFGATEAKLYYEVIKSNEKYSLLKVKIEGGKFHQIRAQLSIAGFPIVGDVKYKGERWDNEKAIALCATGLAFRSATEPDKSQRHFDGPVTMASSQPLVGDEMVSLSIEIPQEWEKYL